MLRSAPFAPLHTLGSSTSLFIPLLLPYYKAFVTATLLPQSEANHHIPLASRTPVLYFPYAFLPSPLGFSASRDRSGIERPFRLPVHTEEEEALPAGRKCVE